MKDLSAYRHTFAHVLMQALQRLYPGAIPASGPAIETGFYHDFDCSHQVTEADFVLIEEEMRKIIAEGLEVKKTVMPLKEAKKFLDKKGYVYAKEYLDDVKEGGGEEVSFYEQGDFINMCAGPHVSSTGELDPESFKLTKVAGAYFKGDAKNKMLQRVYALVFASKAELDAYVKMMEEAKKHDHRKIGKALELFFISQDVGSGLPIFMPKGLTLRKLLEDFIVAEKKKRGYQFVWTPHLAKSTLYKKSGHWQKYDAMYNPMKIDEEEYVVKPMNCPHHFQVYLERPRSYRELPLRIAENGTVYRYEKAGELNGLLRVRSLTQDDTHMFIRESQIESEIDGVLEFAAFVYKVFGFSSYKARISVRDPKKKEGYLGSDEVWTKAEKALIAAVEKRGIPYFIGEGEAAFYGPKIDVTVNDAIGRAWQLTTVQLDFNQPVNFDMTYVNEKGEQERPAILHVAIFGSFERFLAILIEHYDGAFPAWLSPVQLHVIPVGEKHGEAAGLFAKQCDEAGLRVWLDDSGETVGSKIRRAMQQKVPYFVVMGDKEVEAKNISVRKRGEKEAVVLDPAEFIESVKSEVKTLS